MTYLVLICLQMVLILLKLSAPDFIQLTNPVKLLTCTHCMTANLVLTIWREGMEAGLGSLTLASLLGLRPWPYLIGIYVMVISLKQIWCIYIHPEINCSLHGFYWDKYDSNGNHLMDLSTFPIFLWVTLNNSNIGMVL